jgi:hypothetical protein
MTIKTQQISSLDIPTMVALPKNAAPSAFQVPLLRELPGATSACHHHQHLGIFDCGTLPKITGIGWEGKIYTGKTHGFF